VHRIVPLLLALVVAAAGCSDDSTSLGIHHTPDLVWEVPRDDPMAPPACVASNTCVIGQFVLVGDGDDGCVDCNPIDQAVVVVRNEIWRLEVDNGVDRVVSVTRRDDLDPPLIVELFSGLEYRVPQDSDRLGLVEIP
jgi:hypothetical protein